MHRQRTGLSPLALLNGTARNLRLLMCEGHLARPAAS
jgi:hypothetical protein